MEPTRLAGEAVAHAVGPRSRVGDPEDEATQDGVVVLGLSTLRDERGNALVSQVQLRQRGPSVRICWISDDTLMTQKP
jgi:hypothetical protein